MNREITTRIVVWLWGAWAIAWVLASLGTARTVRRYSIPAQLVHRVLLIVGAALLIVPMRHPLPLTDRVLPHSPVLGWGGAALVGLGLAFSAWARIHLGRYWSANVTLKAEHEIVRTGPYRLSRNPIYTGMAAAFLGTAVAVGTLGAALAVVPLNAGLLVKIHQEEHLLAEHFGEAYADYRRQVRRLIPFVW